MEIDEAINHILEGQSIIFVGTGFSMGADSTVGKIPTASELTKILDKETGNDSNGDLGEAANFYIEEKGAYQIIPLLEDNFTCKQTTPAQDTISGQNWLRVYTTNYDDIVEIGGRKAGRHRRSVTLADKLHDFKDLRNIVVHLNGCITNLTPETLNDEFKLTNASYLTQDFRNSEWISLFSYDLKDAKSIFFVGFSMKYDLDIKRIVSSEAYKEKCFFIVAEHETRQNIRQLENFGAVLPIGTNRFAEMINERSKKFVMPATSMSPVLLCFNHYGNTYTRSELKDTDVLNLYLRGVVSKNLIYYSIKEPDNYPYYIYRDKLDKVIQLIENGTSRFVFHSDLGNGKTFFIIGLSLKLSTLGYSVFEFKRDEVSLGREIEQICSIKDKKVVIILENYSSYKDVINLLKLKIRDQILIFTERSVKNDMAIDALSNDFGKIHEIDLNVLTDGEIERTIKVMDEYGLWGSYSTLRDNQKRERIIQNYHRNLCPILLDVISSPTIIGRYKQEVDKFKKSSSIYEILVMILVSKYLDLNLDVDMLAVAINDDLYENYTLKRNSVLKEFVDFSSLEINVRSSIFSEALLKNVIDPAVIGKVLTKAFKRINVHRQEAKYKRILMSLLSSANLIRLISRKNENNQSVLIEFFEQIRGCEFCKRNPHYWLQYAIIKLNEPDYEVADRYFKNAYAYAKIMPNFDTYQIDNHFARYLLENSTYSIDDPDYMDTIEKVQNILTEPNHLKSTKYYPFRVAQNYLPFYEKYKNRMSKKEKEKFSSFSMKLLNMIDEYKKAAPAYGHRRDVNNAKRVLEQIVSDISCSQISQT